MRKDTFRLIRLYSKMSQAEFAKYLGLSKSTVGLIETGQREITPYVMSKLVDKFDMDDDFLSYIEKFRKLSH